MVTRRDKVYPAPINNACREAKLEYNRQMLALTDSPPHLYCPFCFLLLPHDEFFRPPQTLWKNCKTCRRKRGKYKRVHNIKSVYNHDYYKRRYDNLTPEEKAALKERKRARYQAYKQREGWCEEMNARKRFKRAMMKKQAQTSDSSPRPAETTSQE